jgi:excisionase family DNA binding protein
VIENFPEDTPFRPLAVRIREACRLTGIGRSKLNELIGAGEIEIVKVGTITLIPIHSLQKLPRTAKERPISANSSHQPPVTRTAKRVSCGPLQTRHER